MVAKKYKLYSASGENGRAPCAFFASEAGCRNGDKCKFLHVLPDAAPVIKESSSSSVVSSESEGDATPIAVEPANSNKEKKNKKRKSNASDDIFAKPKRHNLVKETPTLKETNKKQKIDKKSEKKKTQQASLAADVQLSNSPAQALYKHSLKKPKQEAPNFRSLALPIASFSIGSQAPTMSPVLSPAVKDEPLVQEIRPLPLPNHTATGRKWQKAIINTRKHVRYSGSFDFEKMKQADEEAGRGYATDWITAREFGAWCAENPQAIAIDCEMCETRDPVSGAIDSKALCRISVIDAENPDEVLLDTLVKPAWPVVDYRSRINGIKEEHLANVQFTLRHAQAFLMALCSNETVIIGHALHNDFAALKMEHHCMVDSSFLFSVKDAPNATPSLKDLASSVIKKEMPPTHDSVNDARAALLCLKTYLSKNGKVDPIERPTLRNPIASTQLFVHRIPKVCKPSHLNTMFLSHADIQPSEVDEIEFKGDTGRTHVTFRTSRHANLAFDTLDGKTEADASGRMQKKVYLKNGGYVRVRMMVHQRCSRRESDGDKSDDDSK
jgi:RNA exonuclease 1